jgi:hypothetical protein
MSYSELIYKRCRCGRFLEPNEKHMKSGLCGICDGEVKPEEAVFCFDGSVCDRKDRNCNKCEWMKH